MTDIIFSPQAKLLWHGDRVKKWVETGCASPILVEIAPTGYCNANCPWCFFSDKHGSGQIDKAVLLRSIAGLSGMGLKAVNWTGGGEPTLHPDFPEFVEYTASQGLKQGLFTNGYLEIPNQDRFSWIRISLTDLGYGNIVIPKVPFGICVNHVSEQTPEELDGLCLGAKKIGAAYFQIRPALIGSYLEQPRLEIPNHLSSHQGEGFRVHVTGYKYSGANKGKEYPECYGYHFCPSIDWTGKISACLYRSMDRDYILGDLTKDNVESIFESIPGSMAVNDRCQNCCKNDQINKLLWEVKNIQHVDFL